MLDCINYTADIKGINTFDRNIELANGLETDYLRMYYYEFDHYYKEYYKNYEYYKLCTVFRGSKHIEVNNQESFVHNNGEFVVVPPYSTSAIEVTYSRSMVFEISDILLDMIRKKAYVKEDFECDPMERERHPLFKGKSEFIQTEIEKIISTALGDSKNKEFLIDLYAQEMIYKLLNHMSSDNILKKQNNNSIHRAIELMKTGCINNMDISEIAHAVSMSPALFSMKFKKITGLSPNAYYTNIKLNEAKKMLKDKSVTEVAYDLGYDNISHFIRLFFEKFRLTPKQYQLQFYTNLV